MEPRVEMALIIIGGIAAYVILILVIVSLNPSLLPSPTYSSCNPILTKMNVIPTTENISIKVAPLDNKSQVSEAFTGSNGSAIMTLCEAWMYNVTINNTRSGDVLILGNEYNFYGW
jgi:hypothetical protein